MRVDIHVHSSYSNDGTSSPEEILRYAKKIGLNGISITDHNVITGSLKLWKNNKEKKDFVVIPGIEVSSNQGHILALGVTKAVPRDLSPVETIESINKLGGIAIAPHPYRFWSGLGEEAVSKAGFDVIEVINSRSLKKENSKAEKLARELKCGETGGSDSHTLRYLGNAYTEFQNTSYDMDDILEDIRKKKTKGSGIHRKMRETPGYAAGCVYLWLKRGMKRM